MFCCAAGTVLAPGTHASSPAPVPSSWHNPQHSLRLHLCLLLLSSACAAHAGGNLLLTATVTGPGSPFTYHWQALDPASGGTSADYTLLSAKFTNVTADASGNSTSYTLTVTNGCGFANSANVTVAVGAAGSDTLLTLQPTTVPSGEQGSCPVAAFSGFYRL